jgi:hypothetical protein
MQKLGKAVILLAALALIYEALVPQFIITSVKVIGRQIYPIQRKK